MSLEDTTMVGPVTPDKTVYLPPETIEEAKARYVSEALPEYDLAALKADVERLLVEQQR